MTHWKNYHTPRTVEEALERLSAAAGPARIVAGGTDLLLDLQQGRHPPVDTLVDVSAIGEMTALEARGGQVFIGAAVPLRRIAELELLRRRASALVEACALIGGPQVRNVATLGGNVAHALPAADGSIALLALDASAEVARCDGERLRLPLVTLFAGPGQSALDPQADLLVGFHLHLAGVGEGSAFRRVMRPQGVALPVINMAAFLRVAKNGSVEVARISVGPAGKVPARARAAEAALIGQPVCEDSIAAAAEALLAELSFRTSPRRAGRDYRKHLAGVLLEEVLTCADKRARGDQA